MIRVTTDEVKKIAKMSAIEVHEDELALLARDMDAVLSYASVLQEVAARYSTTAVEPLPKNSNTMRQDSCTVQQPEVILEAAPERIENYFVVPVIVK